MRSQVSLCLVSLALAPLGLLALVGLLGLAPGAVSAQPRRIPQRQQARQAPPAPALKRVLVERFSGPQASRVRAGLLADLGDHADTITIVSESELRTAAQTLGIARVRSEADYAAVAQQLNVAAFIDGRVARRGRSWTLTVRVRGADGSILGSETWSGGTMNALGAVRRNGHSRLAQYLDAANPPTPPQPEVPETPERAWHQQEGAESVETPEDPDEEDDAPEGDNRYTAFRVGLGAGTLFRSMSTEVIPLYGTGAGATEGAAEPRSYSSAGLGHGELAIDGEFFPGAFGSQPFPYIGLAFHYRAGVGLQSTGCAQPMGSIECPEDIVVKSSQSDFYLGLRGRYAFGSPASGPQLDFDVGYGYFAFGLDLAALERLDPKAIIPPVGYSFLNLGAGISYPVVPTYLSIGARFAYRASLGVSADQKQVWGVETSSAPGFLLGLDVKSQMPYIVRGLYIAFAFQYFAFSTTYEGEAACTAEPCRPWTAPATPEMRPIAGSTWQPVRVPDSVGDSYIRLAFSIGYEFR